MFGEKSSIGDEYIYIDFFKYNDKYHKDISVTKIIFDTYKEALNEINEDKIRETPPIDVITHDID